MIFRQYSSCNRIDSLHFQKFIPEHGGYTRIGKRGASDRGFWTKENINTKSLINSRPLGSFILELIQ